MRQVFSEINGLSIKREGARRVSYRDKEPANCPKCGLSGRLVYIQDKPMVRHMVKLFSEKSGMRYRKTKYCELE